MSISVRSSASRSQVRLASQPPIHCDDVKPASSASVPPARERVGEISVREGELLRIAGVKSGGIRRPRLSRSPASTNHPGIRPVSFLKIQRIISQKTDGPFKPFEESVRGGGVRGARGSSSPEDVWWREYGRMMRVRSKCIGDRDMLPHAASSSRHHVKA